MLTETGDFHFLGIGTQVMHGTSYGGNIYGEIGLSSEVTQKIESLVRESAMRIYAKGGSGYGSFDILLDKRQHGAESVKIIEHNHRFTGQSLAAQEHENGSPVVLSTFMNLTGNPIEVRDLLAKAVQKKVVSIVGYTEHQNGSWNAYGNALIVAQSLDEVPEMINQLNSIYPTL